MVPTASKTDTYIKRGYGIDMKVAGDSPRKRWKKAKEARREYEGRMYGFTHSGEESARLVPTAT